ncbi:hypothetical protein [Psychrosphaera aestuarii]|uniref:hypothetical protein n=1 Tax=Psychrosphaera aestuarii TaxID=1266052 RepID=UPI001B3396F4|nr:hypothetical protein [Psychrosphaera aestuarii]
MLKIAPFLSKVIITTSLILSSNSYAEFKLDGNLTVVDPYGKTHTKEMPMGFASSAEKQTFTIGPHTYKVPGQPEKYSIAIVLQDNNFVWVQEFHNKPIKTFEWQLGEHKISLIKEILMKPVKGDYILSIDDKDYFFNNRLAQVTFIFNEEGIENIDVSGMVASLGLNRAQDKCETSSDDQADSEDDATKEDSDNEDDKCPPPK